MLVNASPMNSSDPITFVKLALANKYEIISEIGRGGMANVYKAKQKSLGRLVALKVFHQSMVHDKELFERFQREARIYATLKHPNIVNIYDVGYENGYHFISMEYISGENLLRLIRQRGKLEPEQTVKIIVSIAEALDYAHNKGIIHRDIKSSNILISEGGEIYLTDFGIAHAAHEAEITVREEALGTPQYMSPEQIELEELDGRTDYYSLGVVMYECLTGHVPFSASNPLLVLDKIRTSDTPDVSIEVSGLGIGIIKANRSLLEKNRNERISNNQMLKEALSVSFKDFNEIFNSFSDIFGGGSIFDDFFGGSQRNKDNEEMGNRNDLYDINRRDIGNEWHQVNK